MRTIAFVSLMLSNCVLVTDLHLDLFLKVIAGKNTLKYISSFKTIYIMFFFVIFDAREGGGGHKNSFYPKKTNIK